MRTRFTSRALRGESGSAAAEMALVAPLMLLLAFGAVEAGNFFYNQHILTKAVRDGARFAARQPFGAYDMDACVLSNDAQASTRRLVRTAQLLTPGAAGRIPDWDEADEASTIDITVACDSSGSYSGVYVENGNIAAAVTVEARVPYTPLVGFALDWSGRSIGARSQAAVTGI